MSFFKQITIWSVFLLISQIGFASNLPEGFSETTIITELNPTAMTITPDGRIFVLEKDGRVLVVENDVLLPDPLIELEVDYNNERGLGGIALDPNFENNQYFYLYYTVPGENHNRVSRFTANGNTVVPGSEVKILDLDVLEGSIHNGGAMAFGADGKLYIATGDGARSSNSQELSNLLGKILRINKDGSIPEDNPFYSQASGVNRAIWALGLRNPFSFAIDPVTGTMLVNDVGQSGWEEVNKIVKGKNYGWPLLEGKNRKNKPEPENYQEPLYDYNHQVGCSIIGAAFYNPDQYTFPERYHGKYFFADYCQGFIKVLDPETGEELETFATGVARPLAFIVAPDGTFYYLERGNSGGNTSASRGALVKVTYSGDLTPFISSQPSSQEVSIGDNVTFQVVAGGKQPLSYRWYSNGEEVEGEDDASFTISNVTMEDNETEVYVEVSNDYGTVRSEKAVLNVTENTAPQAVINNVNLDMYKAGETLEVSGYAIDSEDGDLPESSLSWWINFHHDDHNHPALELVEGENAVSYEIPRIGETSDNVWYRIYLKATDSQGTETTVYQDVYPIKSDFEVQSQPEGLTVYLDGAPVTTPTVTTGVVGVTRQLRAPATQEVNGTAYVFDRWSNGSEELEISFNVPEENSTWVAIYEEVEAGPGEGLVGAYYATEEGEVDFSGEPELVRVDPQINFNWDTEAPAEGVPADAFHVRWTGLIQPMMSGEHTFYASANDGVRLWINDELVIDQWSNAPVEDATGTVVLEVEKRYQIRLEYYDREETASVMLEWSTEHLGRTIIPSSQFYPTPILLKQPASQQVYAGEEVNFNVEAGGKQPLTYQWYKNGAEIPEGNSATVTISEVTLEDNGAEIYVEVSNDHGTVQSEKAVLTVIENTIPQVIIDHLKPAMYQAGDTIRASGFGVDGEDGNLPKSELSWWIDFHHGEEVSTAMDLVEGENIISYVIPRTGETSHEVWYRIYLKAVDSRGGEKTVYKDLHPQKSEFEVQTQPAGLMVYLDDAPTTTPTATTSVVGLTRQLRAPATQDLNGVTYVFDRWSNGSEELEISFNVPEENSTWVAIYQELEPGSGEGLVGAYYATENTAVDFSGEPELVRIDPQINFDWGTEAPAEEVPADGFHVRWTGLLQPMVSGEHTFYASANDGVRLWIDEELVIDQWSNDPVEDASGTIVLEAEKRYQIRLEYYEMEGTASVMLQWSTEHMEPAVIPSSQFYPTPTLFTQPVSQQVFVGNEVSFSVEAGGKQPLTYQWFKNGEAIQGTNSATINLSDVTLEDNGSEYHVVVSNAYGNVSSKTAVLNVSQNTAPQVVINEINTEMYKAGEILQAIGSATDEEDGELPAEALSWWIEFHHDGEVTTAVEMLEGENSISYEIPRTGETSANVWYRINLKATDSHGAETTVYKDVQPLKSDFEIQTQPEGLTLYLDGAQASTPLVTTSVVGLTRQLSAPAYQEVDGVLYQFANWSDGSEEGEISFNVPEENSSWVATYEQVQPGTGEGLLGSYYEVVTGEEEFSGEPVLERVDPQIDFEWGTDAVAEEVPADGFLVRWAGMLEPMVSGEHTFHVSAEGGLRLWVNEELLIDQWSNTPLTEASGTIALEAGERYPIVVEYQEVQEEAGVRLEWSSEVIERAVIPTSQLYPEEGTVTAIGDELSEGPVVLYPVPTGKVLNMKFPDSFHGNMPPSISLLNSIGAVIMEVQPVQVKNNHWQIDVDGLPGGVYFIRSNDFPDIIKFLKK